MFPATKQISRFANLKMMASGGLITGDIDCCELGRETSFHSTINVSGMEKTTWKRSGITIQLHVNCYRGADKFLTDLLPDVFCLMFRIFRLMLVLLYIYIYIYIYI